MNRWRGALVVERRVVVRDGGNHSDRRRLQRVQRSLMMGTATGSATHAPRSFERRGAEVGLSMDDSRAALCRDDDQLPGSPGVRHSRADAAARLRVEGGRLWNIVSWFSLAYGIGMLGMGRLLDRIGTRRGFGLAIVAWSVAAMGHAAARSAATFSLARGLLGLGESGNFPAAIKTVSEWFPNSERALAVGIFNAGSNVGAVLRRSQFHGSR